MENESLIEYVTRRLEEYARDPGIRTAFEETKAAVRSWRHPMSANSPSPPSRRQTDVGMCAE
jgi:hypothetical protein